VSAVAATRPLDPSEVYYAERRAYAFLENLRQWRCQVCMDDHHIFPLAIVDRDAYKAQRIKGAPRTWEDRPACPNCHGLGRVPFDPLIHSTPLRAVVVS